MELYDIMSFISPELMVAIKTFPRDIHTHICSAFAGIFDVDMAWKKLETFALIHENIQFLGRFPGWLRLAATRQSYYVFMWSVLQKMADRGESMEYLGLADYRIQQGGAVWVISTDHRKSLRRLYKYALIREMKKNKRKTQIS